MSADQTYSATVNPFTTDSARRALFALRAHPCASSHTPCCRSWSGQSHGSLWH